MSEIVRRPEGCKNLHIAKQIKGEDGALTFAPFKRLIGLEEVGSTNNYAEGSAYSDNMQDTYVRRAIGTDLNIVLRQLSSELEAEIMGKEFTKGKKITRNNDNAPKFAVAYEQTNSDGSSTYKVFYNCTLAKDENTNTTVKDGVEYDVVTVGGKALPCPELGGVLDLEFESDATGVTPQEIASFFKTVMLPPVDETPSGISLNKGAGEVKEEE